jgi:phospholipid/cholesterol/gamma-HCH transport system substrate-binding protein
MENKSHALAAGIFVLALTAMLISLAVWLTRDTRALHVFELSGRVNVTGLQPQASVRFRGVPIGKVTSIGLDPQARGQVLVRIAVDDQAPITSTTYASLGFQGVTGLAFIQLDDSGDPGAAVPSAVAQIGRIPLKPGLMSKLTDQGERLLGQLEQATQRFNQLLSNDNQQVVMTALGNLGKAAGDLQQLSSQSRQILPELAQTALETLSTVKATSVRVGDSADSARTSARAFQKVTERMYGPGGTLDQISQGSEILIATGQVLQTSTLPRLNRAVADTSRTLQHIGSMAQTLNDTPQALLLGKPGAIPGPGEPGFVAAPIQPR